MSSKTIKQYALPTAMSIGSIGYPYLSKISFLSPYFISLILILTFTKLSPKHIKISPSHILLLILQIVLGIMVYIAIEPYDLTIAQGAMISILIPTATTAPVATRILGGNVGYVTTYLFLSNCVMALVIPTMFTLTTDTTLPLLESFVSIIKRIGTLLVAPLIIIWFIRFVSPKLHQKLENISYLTFHIWAITLMITTSSTVNYVANQPDFKISTIAIMALVAMVLSTLQLIIGRKIGSKIENTISCGQAFGQKNTILAIWIAQTFLNPASSIIPAFYVISQNLINSYQIWHKEHKESKESKKIATNI